VSEWQSESHLGCRHGYHNCYCYSVPIGSKSQSQLVILAPPDSRSWILEIKNVLLCVRYGGTNAWFVRKVTFVLRLADDYYVRFVIWRANLCHPHNSLQWADQTTDCFKYVVRVVFISRQFISIHSTGLPRHWPRRKYS